MNEIKSKKVGGIFFIPLFLPKGIKDNRKNYKKYGFDPNEKYAFGRLIEENSSSGDLIEIFSYVGNIPEKENIIIESGLLLPPVHISLAFSRNRWQFIFDNPSYDKQIDSKYSSISFLLGDPDNRILWKGGKESPIAGDVSAFDEWIVYPPTKLEKLILEALNLPVE